MYDVAEKSVKGLVAANYREIRVQTVLIYNVLNFLDNDVHLNAFDLFGTIVSQM